MNITDMNTMRLAQVILYALGVAIGWPIQVYGIDPDVVEAARAEVQRCQERVEHMARRGSGVTRYDMLCDDPVRLAQVRERAVLDDQVVHTNLYGENNSY